MEVGECCGKQGERQMLASQKVQFAGHTLGKEDPSPAAGTDVKRVTLDFDVT